jgi:hypothetical protein
MLDLLVETKNEYTFRLINILTPNIYEGIQSIYKKAQKVANNNNTLKIFQSFLKRIPEWNNILIDRESLIECETKRILMQCEYETKNIQKNNKICLNDLIKAVIKANITILVYNPTIKNQNKINTSLYQNINTTEFIHLIYMECANEFWYNPYLLFHNYPPIEIKKNQRDCINIIKECIKEAIRKILPIKYILQMYLLEDIEDVEDIKDVEKIGPNNFELIIKPVSKDKDIDVPEKEIEIIVDDKKDDEIKIEEVKIDKNEIDIMEILNKDKDKSKDISLCKKMEAILGNSSANSKTNKTNMSSTSSTSSKTINEKVTNNDKKINDTKENKEEIFDDKLKKYLHQLDTNFETSVNASDDKELIEVYQNGSDNDNIFNLFTM